jgi:hypothetical protein
MDGDFTLRQRSASDRELSLCVCHAFKKTNLFQASYVSQYPPAPSQYRVTFANNVNGGGAKNGGNGGSTSAAANAAAATAVSKPRDLGVTSKSAMSLRMILDASMLSLRNKCEETMRSLTDLSKALAAGSGEELHRQFLECFPELVAAIFGLPAASAGSGGLGVTAAERTTGWLQSATTVEEYESLYQVLHGKGSLFTLLIQLSCLHQAPVYPFPMAALPEDALQVLQTGGGIGGSGAVGSMTSGGGFLAAFLGARMKRGQQGGLHQQPQQLHQQQQAGLCLNMLEFFLFGFAWAATQAGGGGGAGSGSSSSSTGRIASILRSEGSSGSSSSSSGSGIGTLSIDPHRSMFNALYGGLARQFALSLLELEARADAMSGSSLMRGAMRPGDVRDAVGGDSFFQVYVAIVSLFWLHQNPVQFFYAASAAVAAATSSGGAANKGGLFVFRSRYVAPTFLMINALYDLCTLLLYSTAADSTPVATNSGQSAFGVSASFQQTPSSALQLGASPVAVAAGRVANIALRDIVMDDLYRFLKLGLIFAPSKWRHLATLWRLVALPWTQSPAPDVYAALVRTHERSLVAQQERDRQLAYGAPPAAVAAAAQLMEEFPYSTQVVSPFDPASLKSPFVIPKPKGVGSSTATTGMTALSNMFNLSAIFGIGTPSGGAELTAGGTSAIALKAPQNWGWFTFYDTNAPLGALWMAARATPAGDAHPTAADIRAVVTANYPLYSLLLRAWLLALHEHFVEQTQPLSYGLLVSLERIIDLMTSGPVLAVLRELETTIHQPLDRFADGRLELEKRQVLERWMVLEHSSMAPGSLFADPHLAELAVDLLKEAFVYARLSTEVKTPVLQGLVSALARQTEVLFAFPRGELDARLEAALLSARGSTEQSASAARATGVEGLRGAPSRLSQEQQSLLRQGKLRMDRSGIGFLGDAWDKPVSSSESYIVLWILFRISLLLGLAERKPNATKTYFNLRPLGNKLFLWSIVVLVIAVVVVSRLSTISFGGMFDLDDEDE